MVWLGIVLAPFGSGKTTHRDFFSAYLPGSKARVLSVDDYVYRHPRYRKAIAEARPNRKSSNTSTRCGARTTRRNENNIAAGSGQNICHEL